MNNSPEKYKLSEKDHEAIAKELWLIMKKELYINTGKGFIHIIWKIVLLGLFTIAVYGYSKGWYTPA